MSCPDNKHDLRAVNPWINPADGGETVGAPPQNEEEPAWCRHCGALWSKMPFNMGWGFMHPDIDKNAPTLGNIIREEINKE